MDDSPGEKMDEMEYRTYKTVPKEFECVVRLARCKISEPVPDFPVKRKKPTSDLPKLSAYEQQRLQNLRDNKEMLAKLLDDLKSELGPSAFLSMTKGKKSTPKPKVKKEVTPARRNPSRRARDGGSTGTSRSPSPSSEESLPLGFGFLKRYRDSDDEDDDDPEPRRKSRSDNNKHFRTIERDTRGPEDITEEDLRNVCDFAREKKWDTVHGTSCHQCRQKTIDQKTICRDPDCWGVRGQFCGPCLRNRYGEDVREALKDPDWTCPPCRRICNCSFCRARAGKACTGILIHLAREHGYNDVNSFLQSFRGKK